jgi:exonuclease III
MAGGTRLARIVEEISDHDPDVIALTEFRARPGVALCAAMKERGLPHVETTRPAENQNGIAVFSRTPMGRTRPCPAPYAGLVRWLDIDLSEYSFGIGVLHVMAAGSSAGGRTLFLTYSDRVLQVLGAGLRRALFPVSRTLLVDRVRERDLA